MSAPRIEIGAKLLELERAIDAKDAELADVRSLLAIERASACPRCVDAMDDNERALFAKALASVAALRWTKEHPKEAMRLYWFRRPGHVPWINLVTPEDVAAGQWYPDVEFAGPIPYPVEVPR